MRAAAQTASTTGGGESSGGGRAEAAVFLGARRRQVEVGRQQLPGSRGQSSPSRGRGHHLVLHVVEHLRGKPAHPSRYVTGRPACACGSTTRQQLVGHTARERSSDSKTNALCEVSELAEDVDEAGHGEALEDRVGGIVVAVAHVAVGGGGGGGGAGAFTPAASSAPCHCHRRSLTY